MEVGREGDLEREERARRSHERMIGNSLGQTSSCNHLLPLICVLTVGSSSEHELRRGEGRVTMHANKVLRRCRLSGRAV